MLLLMASCLDMTSSLPTNIYNQLVTHPTSTSVMPQQTTRKVRRAICRNSQPTPPVPRGPPMETATEWRQMSSRAPL